MLKPCVMQLMNYYLELSRGNDMKKFLEAAGFGLVIVAVLAIVIGLSAYKFNDCKRVGHSTLYCILDLSK